MFCPFFFRKTYLNRLSDQPAVPKSELGKLSTYEHILAHELLHCEITGTKEPGKCPIGLRLEALLIMFHSDRHQRHRDRSRWNIQHLRGLEMQQLGMDIPRQWAWSCQH